MRRFGLSLPSCVRQRLANLIYHFGYLRCQDLNDVRVDQLLKMERCDPAAGHPMAVQQVAHVIGIAHLIDFLRADAITRSLFIVILRPAFRLAQLTSLRSRAVSPSSMSNSAVRASSVKPL